MSMLDRDAVRHDFDMGRKYRNRGGCAIGFVRVQKKTLKRKSRKAARRVILAELIHLEDEIMEENERLYLEDLKAPEWWDEDGKPDDLDRHLESKDDPYEIWDDYEPPAMEADLYQDFEDEDEGQGDPYADAIHEALMDTLYDMDYIPYWWVK